jgi:hypothetical protein
MSVELYVFVQESNIPTRDAWQKALEDSKFPTVLNSSFEPRKDSGFSPATYKGQSSGYEFYLDSAKQILANYSHIKKQVGDRDRCVTFCWGGDLTECAAAMSSAAALTKVADGIYYYPDDDLLFNADDVVEVVRQELESI